jgi:hypothetical protein
VPGKAAADGRLNAGPNLAYDSPQFADELPTLPIRQLALINTILVGIPRNAPKHLRASLRNYADELKTRGVQPILGLLKDMAQIIEVDVGAPAAAREWLEPGLVKAFSRFAENHSLFMTHFPLDLEREQLYSCVSFDENRAMGRSLSQPFENVAKAAQDLNNAGGATDDFLKIVTSLAEFARIISTQPPARSEETRRSVAVPVETAGLTISSAAPGDTHPPGRCYSEIAGEREEARRSFRAWIF